jgi:hypothetical protein
MAWQGKSEDSTVLEAIAEALLNQTSKFCHTGKIAGFTSS